VEIRDFEGQGKWSRILEVDVAASCRPLLLSDAILISTSHTYMPKCPVHFTGPSYFGGQDYELILCAGKSQ